jgi:hypothetical protein
LGSGLVLGQLRKGLLRLMLTGPRSKAFKDCGIMVLGMQFGELRVMGRVIVEGFILEQQFEVWVLALVYGLSDLLVGLIVLGEGAI